MEGTQVTEPFNEWEQIQSPISLHISPTMHSREWEIVVDSNLDQDDEFSAFPPSNQEGLQIPPPPPPQQQPEDSRASNPPSSIRCDVEGGEEDERLQSDSRPRIGNETWKIMRSGIGWIASRVSRYLVCRGGFWSFASATLVFTAVLLYSRLQRWRQWVRKERRNKLILLVKEKDQKIQQLLLQIAQLNGKPSARPRVQVARVG